MFYFSNIGCVVHCFEDTDHWNQFDLNLTVQVRVRSDLTSPFESPGMISYRCLIVALAILLTVMKIWPLKFKWPWFHLWSLCEVRTDLPILRSSMTSYSCSVMACTIMKIQPVESHVTSVWPSVVTWGEIWCHHVKGMIWFPIHVLG